jgi:signal transduction histidine kinase
MSSTVALGVGLALIAGVAIGYAAGLALRRARLRRIEQGVSELARGNFAHRIILPGQDEAARVAEDLNTLADSVQQEREEAAVRDGARRRLLTNISHDLRTPITSIAGYVDALQRGLGNDPERYLAVIAEKADELAQLTDDLFYAARLDAGDLELKRQPLDLAEAVRRSVLGFEPQIAVKNVRVEVTIPEERCLVEADPSAVSRILSNLLSNGLRHGEGMTAFSVAMLAQDGGYAVCVSNDGARLPNDAEQVFERGVSGTAGGTGLGLSIARELAERMGAAVAAENNPEGSVDFTLTFPAI